ncbi:MAG TPA: Gfo/Idh/MocA family oxidoreductase, partial [Luteimonas sp.]|nr:Gfo/Idh/MocA family oxidoreductase [Luteimonas sp.]
NRRWDSDFLGIRAAIASGVVGTVVHFESHFDRFRPQVRARWREQAGPGSGLWFDLGPHLVDQALQLFGLPDAVSARFAIQRAGGATDDWAHVCLDYGPCRVILHGSMLVAGGSARFTVHGDRGSLVKHAMDRQEAQLLSGMRPGAPGWGHDPDPIRFFDGSDGAPRAMPTPPGDQRRYYAGIRDAIAGSGMNPVTPLQAIAVMAVLEAGVRSAHTQRSVALALHAGERQALSVDAAG